MPFETISIKGTLSQESFDIFLPSRVSRLAVISNLRATPSTVWLDLAQIWQRGKKPSERKISCVVTGYERPKGNGKMDESCHLGLD